MRLPRRRKTPRARLDRLHHLLAGGTRAHPDDRRRDGGEELRITMDVSKAHDKATVEATLLGRISTHRAKIGSTMRSLPMTTALILINVALVCITAWYALTTHRLLSESQ